MRSLLLNPGKGRHLLSWAIFIGSLFLLFNHRSAWSLADQNMGSVKMLFQERIFNLPSDHFFVVEMDRATGKSRVLETIEYEKALGLYGKEISVIDGQSNRAFILWESPDRKRVFVYLRNGAVSGGSYSYVLLDKLTGKIVRELPASAIVGIIENSLIFIEPGSSRMQEINFDNLIEKTVLSGASSFIPLGHEEFLLFYPDGNMKKFSKGELGKIRQVGGVVTEAGIVDNRWGWFCKRRNEKSTGQIFFIDLEHIKIIKGEPSNLQCHLVKVLKKSD